MIHAYTNIADIRQQILCGNNIGKEKIKENFIANQVQIIQSIMRNNNLKTEIINASLPTPQIRNTGIELLKMKKKQKLTKIISIIKDLDFNLRQIVRSKELSLNLEKLVQKYALRINSDNRKNLSYKDDIILRYELQKQFFKEAQGIRTDPEDYEQINKFMEVKQLLNIAKKIKHKLLILIFFPMVF